jgi:hypothetical protein
MYGATSEAQVIVPTDGAAAPAEAWFSDERGRCAQPCWYESASRAVWRRLLAAVAARETTLDLASIAADIDVAATTRVRLEDR